MKRVPKGTAEDLIREDTNVVQMDTNFVIFMSDLSVKITNFYNVMVKNFFW